jgi:hypothetical protein
MAMQQAAYPVQFSVEYPDRPLNRLTTAFRIFVAIQAVSDIAFVAWVGSLATIASFWLADALRSGSRGRG